MGKYPEHEKLAASNDDLQVILKFLDWADEEGVFLAMNTKLFGAGHEGIVPVENVPELLGKYYGIDVKLLEKEREEMKNES